jgi:hypothetical protein
MKGTLWREEEITKLCDMWEAGKSLVEIAKELNRTKGTIAGKVDRLKKAGRLEGHRDPLMERRIKMKSAATKAPKPRKRHSKAKGDPLAELDALAPEIVLPGVGLEDLTMYNCRWLMTEPHEWNGDPRYCGKSGFPWCPEHKIRVYGKRA